MTFLKLFSIITVFIGASALCLTAAMAEEILSEGNLSEEQALPQFYAVQHRSLPEVQSYAALCRAVYWQHIAHQTIDEAERVEKYQMAVEQLMEAIRFDPRSSFLYTKLAETYIYLQDPGRATSACERAIELDPGNANAHFWLARLKLTKREAIRELKTATELNPEHFQAQYFLAFLLYEMQDFQGAAHAYAAVVKVGDKAYDPKLRKRLGYSYLRIGKISEAIMEFNAAARLDSDDLEVHAWLAGAYARQSRNKEAIEECLIVLAQSPEDANTILLLTELYVAMDEFDKAIPRLENLVTRRRLDKDVLAEAHYRLATAYKGKDEPRLSDMHFQRSVDLYKEILKDQPDNPKNIGIHYRLAAVYDAKGDMSLAEWHLREYIDLEQDESNASNAYNYLGYMFVQNGVNLDEALRFIKKAVETEPENGAFRDSLGWAYFKLGDLDRAISELEKAVELIPDDSEVHEHLGEVYLRKGGGFAQKGVAQWEEALKIKPNNTELRQRLAEELSKSLE